MSRLNIHFLLTLDTFSSIVIQELKGKGFLMMTREIIRNLNTNNLLIINNLCAVF